MKQELMVSKKLPIAKLAGVIENNGGPGSCRLVFALQADDSADDPERYVYLNYGLMLDALRFAQEQGIMPTLSEHWWARVERTDGCTFQD